MNLLTGGTGFLGKYILRELLKKGEKVRVMARNPEKVDATKFPGAEFFKGNLLDPIAVAEAMKGITKIIHCAAVVSFSKDERPLMYRINVEGTENLVDAALEADVDKFVHISSIAAIGLASEGQIANEGTKWKPDKYTTHYGTSKYQAEKAVHRGVAEGMKAVVLNPGVIIGAGDDNKSTLALFARLKKGLKFYPEGSLSYVSVTDCARATVDLLRSDYVEGERFVLVSDRLPIRDFMTKAALELGVAPPHKKLPTSMIRAFGGVIEWLTGRGGKQPLITKETARLAGKDLLYDGSKIEKETDFRYTGLDKVIKETAAQFKGQ